MSKGKKIKNLLSKSQEEKWTAFNHPDRQNHNPALYDRADLLRANICESLYYLSKGYREYDALRLFVYRDELMREFIDGDKKKYGGFFRALADALERKDNRAWTKRERFVFAACNISAAANLPLPTAYQILRGWKIACGVIPTRRRDLEFLWKELCPKRPPPVNIRELQEKLRPLLPASDKKSAIFQTIDIQRDAKKFGYILRKNGAKNKAYSRPAGLFSLMGDFTF